VRACVSESERGLRAADDADANGRSIRESRLFEHCAIHYDRPTDRPFDRSQQLNPSLSQVVEADAAMACRQRRPPVAIGETDAAAGWLDGWTHRPIDRRTGRRTTDGRTDGRRPPKRSTTPFACNADFICSRPILLLCAIMLAAAHSGIDYQLYTGRGAGTGFAAGSRVYRQRVAFHFRAFGIGESVRGRRFEETASLPM